MQLMENWKSGTTQNYRVSHYKVTKVNWLWQIEISKPDLVWRWFWNSEIRYFFASQPVFMKSLLSALYSALYWTRCKSPQVLWCQKISNPRIPEPFSNQSWLAYFYLSEPIYFCNFVMADPVGIDGLELNLYNKLSPLLNLSVYYGMMLSYNLNHERITVPTRLCLSAVT